MNIRIAGVVDDSVVDGEGIRMTIFGQGCPHRCPECHNPESWDVLGGYVTTTDAIMEQYLANPLLDGITFSGGEPFLQAEAFVELADRVHEAGGNVWCYTGYTLPMLMEHLLFHGQCGALLNTVDVLVDGRFEAEQKDLTLLFRGSSNQHIWKRTGPKISDWELWQPQKPCQPEGCHAIQQKAVRL